MTSPKVSVLMPVWNAARFLDEAIESILSQDFRDFELVIVDDASTDGSAEILDAWPVRDPRIVLLRNVTNLGTAEAANVGLRAARGEYIARMDADDISLPGRLTAEVAVLDADRSLAMVSMDYQVIDVHGNLLRTEQRALPPEIVDFFLCFGNPLGGHSQVMFRRELAMLGGGYDGTLETGEDYELWTRLARLGRILILPVVGMRYRLHPEQLTVRKLDNRDGRRWIGLSRDALERYLGRKVSEREIVAVTAAWQKRAVGVDAKEAVAVLQEALALFAKEHDRPMVREVKRVLSERIAGSAMVQLHARETGAALRYFARAFAWHPIQTVRATAALFTRALRNRRRRLARARLGRKAAS